MIGRGNRRRGNTGRRTVVFPEGKILPVKQTSCGMLVYRQSWWGFRSPHPRTRPRAYQFALLTAWLCHERKHGLNAMFSAHALSTLLEYRPPDGYSPVLTTARLMPRLRSGRGNRHPQSLFVSRLDQNQISRMPLARATLCSPPVLRSAPAAGVRRSRSPAPCPHPMWRADPLPAAFPRPRRRSCNPVF